jgi:hypothetical protein
VARQQDDEVLPRDHPRERLLPPPDLGERLEVALGARGRLEAEVGRERIAPLGHALEWRVGAGVEEGEQLVDARAIRRLVDAGGARRRARADLAREARRHLGRRGEASGAGAEPEEPREDVLCPLGALPTAERADVYRAVRREPLGDPEPGERAPHTDLQEADPRQMLPLPVEGRAELADLPRFEQRRAELRSGLGDAEVVRLPDQRQRLRRVPARVREIRRQPLAEPHRLSHVQEPAVVPEKMVDARGHRHLVQPGARHVHDEGAPVDGALLELEQLVETDDVPLRQALEEHAQDLRRDARIRERAMAVPARDAERAGHGVERTAAEPGEQAAREPERADARPVEAEARQRALRGIEVAHVERGVVGDRHVVADELEKCRQRVGDARRGGDHLVRDAGEAGDERRDALPGVHERRERLRETSVDDADGADLDDPRRTGPAARRLEVEHDEARRPERSREGVVDARAPASGRGVEREPLVRAEHGREKSPPELRVAAGRGEDEAEELFARRARRTLGDELVETLPQKVKNPFRFAAAPGAFSRCASCRSSSSKRSNTPRCRSSN